MAQQASARVNPSKGKAAVRPPNYRPLAPQTTAPNLPTTSAKPSVPHVKQQVRFRDRIPVDEEEEDELDLLFNLVTRPTSPPESIVDVASQPPSWTASRVDRKIEYLRAIAPDTHFLALVNWYAKHGVSTVKARYNTTLTIDNRLTLYFLLLLLNGQAGRVMLRTYLKTSTAHLQESLKSSPQSILAENPLKRISAIFPHLSCFF